MTEPNDPSSTPEEQSKKTGGGAAFGGGANFQTSLTAIVGAYILRGKPLGWLDGICDDRPVAVWAESEGPGDDLRIELADGTAIEVQAKKGLVRGDKLWMPLLALAKAINKGQLAYGILAVASDTSSTIRKDLADDIERLGQGRVDRLSEIGSDFLSRLTAEGISAQGGCFSLRIRVIETLLSNNRDINSAKDVLREICERETDVSSALDILSHRALRLIENRGRWTLRDLVLLLKTRGIKLRNDGSPAALLNRHAQWVCGANSDYAIVGVPRRIPIEHLLPMQVEHRSFEQDEAPDALSALERYQNTLPRSSFGIVFDSVWTARFRKTAVVVAGPGLGKSTMLRALANQYAQDGFVVLSASLAWIAAGRKSGKAFSDQLMTKSFDSSGIAAGDVINDNRFNWVVLLDALDECGEDHDAIAEDIRKFSLGHPDARIVVTTRPIGYTSNALVDWPHYSLLPPSAEDSADNLAKLLKAIAPDESHHTDSLSLPRNYGRHNAPSNGFAISPQLLGMSAALILRKRALPGTRIKLYKELIKLFEDAPFNARTSDGADLTDIAIHVLDLTGWFLLENPLLSFNQLVERVAEDLASLIDKPSLPSKGYVRASLRHWERLGLVETVYHDGTKLIAFIHKTFCEFVAARYLSAQSLDLVEKSLERADIHELTNFGVGLGLADKLIDVHLRRHASGQPNQLSAALALLNKPEVFVSDERVLKLIHHSFSVIDDCHSERFAIGISLSEVVGQAVEVVEALAAQRLSSSDPAIKLVAWALFAYSDNLEPESVDVLNELALNAEPFNPAMLFRDPMQDRSDLGLLRRLALGVLKAQPDSQARDFAESELLGKVFSNIGFIFEINGHLESRGIKRLSTPLDRPGNEPATVSLGFAEPQIDEASMTAVLAIAKAFAPRDFSVSSITARERAFPQLAGFLRASGFMSAPFPEVSTWGKPSEDAAARSTLRYVASLLPLDHDSLQQECCELLELYAAGKKSIFDILPYVDIPELSWPQGLVAPSELDEIKQTILHPSAWLCRLAACICKPFAMSYEELEKLLNASSGHSLHHVLYLIALNHHEALMDLALRRLLCDSTGDVSGIFALFLKTEMTPSPQLMDITLMCLCSDSKETGRAATELLQYWLEQGFSLDRARLEQAVNYWGGREAKKHFMSWHTPLHSIIELSDKVGGNFPV